MYCKDCKFWTLDTDKDYPKNIGVGKCKRVKLFWDCTEWHAMDDSMTEAIQVLTEKAKDDKAFVQDGSDYRAELITTPDFGCVQFESI